MTIASLLVTLALHLLVGTGVGASLSIPTPSRTTILLPRGASIGGLVLAVPTIAIISPIDDLLEKFIDGFIRDFLRFLEECVRWSWMRETCLKNSPHASELS